MAIKTGILLTTYAELNAGAKTDTVVVRYSRSEPAAIMIAKDTSAKYKNNIFFTWGRPPGHKGEPYGGGGVAD